MVSITGLATFPLDTAVTINCTDATRGFLFLTVQAGMCLWNAGKRA
jgi:hypothetical protein